MPKDLKLPFKLFLFSLTLVHLFFEVLFLPLQLCQSLCEICKLRGVILMLIFNMLKLLLYIVLDR